MVSIETMIATVQLYIHHRKNVEVNIVIRGAKDIFLLTKAYDVARAWMQENKFKVLNQ